MTREKFTFYGSWWDAVGCLPGELRGEVLTAIIEYGLYGETNSARGSTTKAILELVKPQIDRDRILYDNGCRGGRPRNQTETKPEPNGNQTETKPEPNGNQTETKPEPTSTRTRVSHSLDNNINNQDNNIILDNNLEREKIEKGGAGGKGKKTPMMAAYREQELVGKEESFRKMVRAYSDRYPESMLEAFVSYWTEPNKSRTRLRYELEKTWDTGRRLVTWASRDRTYAPRQPASSLQQEDVYTTNERIRKELEAKYGNVMTKETL